MRRGWGTLCAALVVLVGVGLPVQRSAAAAPVAVLHETGLHETGREGTVVDYRLHSAAMGADIVVKVLPARRAGSPTIYLLNGAAGGYGGSNWFAQTDAADFLAGRDVNVVVPMGGAASYYADWRADDPILGRQKWATFLTDELPSAVDATLAAAGRNAIAGVSMAGTSVFQLSLRAPHLYEAIGSFSGCAQTSDPVGQTFVRLTVEGRGDGNTANMWGPPTDPAWAANDPLVHADAFRGKSIYVANGDGLPGRFDRLDGPGIDDNPEKLGEQLAVGALIESATDYCAHNLARRFRELHIPATVDFYGNGTHSWAYWQAALHNAWPQFAAAIGAHS
ncbi:alpha/beta hydrolase [Gordonia jinhuaensis]